MAQVRSFIAIEISKEAKNEISRIINILKDNSNGIKWVNPENLHLTIKFLGSIPEDHIAEISEKIKKTVLNIPKFIISLGMLGAFPSWRSPRVVYIDLKAGGEKVKHLVEKIENAMEKIGFEREKRIFSPHIAVGRVKNMKNMKNFSQQVVKNMVNSTQMSINSVFLKKSILMSDGPIYSTLYESILKN